jgi:uncharacterized membrane protein
MPGAFASGMDMPARSPIRRISQFSSGALLLFLSGRSRGRIRYFLGSAGILTLLGSMGDGLFSSAVRIRRSIQVRAPVDEVYDFWKRFDNYPRFMSEIREVSVNEQGGLHWVAGPIQWNADVLELQPNQRIAWRSVPGAILKNEGKIRLHALATDLTEVHVELSYAPPAGVLGYAVVHLLGFDPRSKVDSDLRKMRELIETQASRLFEDARVEMRPAAL